MEAIELEIRHAARVLNSHSEYYLTQLLSGAQDVFFSASGPLERVAMPEHMYEYYCF